MTEGAAAKAPVPAEVRAQRLLAWIAAFIILGLALHIDTHKVLWTDEAYSLDTSGGSLARAFHQSIYFELQPPGYYLLLNLWLRLGRSIEFARLLSTVLVVAAMPLLYQIGRLVRVSGWAVSLPLLAALCPYVLWAASEARPYGLALLLSCTTTYLYLRLLVESDGRPKVVSALYVITWYVSLLTFYYSGFLLLAQLVGATLTRRRAGLLALLAGVIGLLLVPWLSIILMQMGAHPATAPAATTAGSSLFERGWAAVTWSFGYTLIAVFFAPLLRRPWVLAVLACGGLVIATLYWRGRRALGRDPAFAALTVCALLPLAALLGSKVFGLLAELWPRYFAAVVVSLLIWIGLVADRLPVARGRAVLGGLMVLFGVLCVVSFQRNAGGTEDWRAAARLVGTAQRPGDVVFVFEPDGVLSFDYYYRGHAPVFGLPVDRPTDTYSVERQAIHSVAQVAGRVHAHVGTSGAFWVVARQQHPAFGRALLDAYLADHATPLVEGRLTGIDVGRFRLRPAAAAGAGQGSAAAALPTP